MNVTAMFLLCCKRELQHFGHSAQFHDLIVTPIYLLCYLEDVLLCLPIHPSAILITVGFMTKQKAHCGTRQARL